MGTGTFGSFVYEHWGKLPAVQPADVEGKTIVVIGANAGLGFEASKHLARMKPGKLIIGCRDSQKSRNALKAIKEATGFENVELWVIDLASFDSVRSFVDRFLKEESRLDILLENAATTHLSSSQTEDGWESTLEVNYLSTALLAILLLPIMIQTGKKFQTIPRLSIVSSGAHMWSRLPKPAELIHSGHFLETFSSKEYCTKEILDKRYDDTKLLEIYFVRSVAEHLGHSPYTPVVNAINPGFCYSELRRDFWSWGMGIYFGSRLLELFFARSTEVGSRTLVHGVTGGVGNEDQMRGAYLSCCMLAEAGESVISLEGKKAREAIWAELIPILEKVDSRVKTIVTQYLSYQA